MFSASPQCVQQILLLFRLSVHSAEQLQHHHVNLSPHRPQQLGPASPGEVACHVTVCAPGLSIQSPHPWIPSSPLVPRVVLSVLNQHMCIIPVCVCVSCHQVSLP